MLHCTVSPRLVNWDRIRNQQPGDMMNHRPFLNTFKLTRPSMDPSANHVAWSASDFEMFCMLPNSHVNLLTSSSIPPWTIENSISVFPLTRSLIFFHYKTTFASGWRKAFAFLSIATKKCLQSTTPIFTATLAAALVSLKESQLLVPGSFTSSANCLKKVEQLVREILVAHKICAWVS